MKVVAQTKLEAIQDEIKDAKIENLKKGSTINELRFRIHTAIADFTKNDALKATSN